MSRSNPSKAQASVEFMIIFALFLLAGIMTMYMTWQRLDEVGSYQRMTEVENLLISVTEKLNTVWLEGEGFRTNMTLPYRLTAGEYDINVTEGYVIIHVYDDEYVKAVVVENLTGTLEKGINTLRNKGGYIEVTH